MSTYDPDLSVYESAWNQSAEVPTVSTDEVPDAVYHCSVHTVEIKTSKAGNLMLAWQLKVIGPSHKGRLIFKQNMIVADAQRLAYLRKDLSTCGIDPGKISTLRDRLELLLDREIEVKVETKGYRNVYINRLIRAPKADAGVTHTLPSEAGVTNELDDTPF